VGAQYDRKPGDIFAVQDEISKEISVKIAVPVDPAETKHHQTVTGG